MKELNIVVGNCSYSYAHQMDERRVSRQNRRSALETREARKARKDQRRAQNGEFEREEGLLYGAGIAD